MSKIVALMLLGLAFTFSSVASSQSETETETAQQAGDGLSLMAATPEEGLQIAIKLARKGVTETQPNKDVLFMLRDVYAKDPDALIAASQVIAIHFQTVAAANNYWREE